MYVCMYRKKTVYRVGYYPQFQASTVGLGTYPLWLRGDRFNDLSARNTKCRLELSAVGSFLG